MLGGDLVDFAQYEEQLTAPCWPKGVLFGLTKQQCLWFLKEQKLCFLKIKVFRLNIKTFF